MSCFYRLVFSKNAATCRSQLTHHRQQVVEALAEAKNATKAATIEEADASTQKHKALPLRGYRYAGVLTWSFSQSMKPSILAHPPAVLGAANPLSHHFACAIISK